MSMQFITEEEVRQRMKNAGGRVLLGENERLTPAAAELLRANNCVAVPAEAHPLTFEHASSIPVPGAPVPDKAGKEPVPAGCPVCRPCIGRTYLDADTQVLKSHPRIELRGRLDTLIAEIVMVQTQFDIRGKLPARLREGLADVKAWVWHMLASEISGDTMPPMSVCGVDGEFAHDIALDPKKYLGQDPIFPDASHGPDVAFLNWLRARTREVEVVLAKMGAREDLMESCNRLSSAIYVLILLTAMAASGKDISQVPAR